MAMKSLEFYMPKIYCAIKQGRCDFDLNDIIRRRPFVPESKRLDILLGEFRNNRNHMAIVVDEYGAVNGFVTIEDIIEQIIGDIEDEFDIDEEAYIKAQMMIIILSKPICLLKNLMNNCMLISAMKAMIPSVES